MKPEEIRIKITEAIDGELNYNELTRLEAELEKHPELKEAYHLIMEKPDLEEAFPLTNPDPFAINRLRKIVQEETEYAYPNWLPAYLAAAAVALFILAGLIQFEMQSTKIDDAKAHEWLHEPTDMLVWNESEFIFIPELDGNGE
jgi:anti-sigma factor RsiW